MLELLTIRNLAVIEHASLELKPGLNILSGETGSGKSIVVESIGLLLGSRASPELIRAGCEEGCVEGVFRMKGAAFELARARFEELGFLYSDGEILIRRLVTRTGRSRIFVNGQLATLQVLNRLTSGFIDFCGQHENQTLTRPAEQIAILDVYAKTTQDASECRELRKRARAIKEEVATLSAQAADRERQLDYVRFQLQELDRIAPVSGEDESLQGEKKLLQTSEQRRQAAEALSGQFEDAESGVFTLMRRLQQRLKALHQIDPTAAIDAARLGAAQSELESMAEEVARYLGGIDGSAERLLEIQERLSALADLKRKYGGSLAEAIASRENLQARESELAGADGRVEELSSELEAIEADLVKREKKLRVAREKASTTLSKQIEAQLSELRMEGARFAIRFGDAPDEIDFLIRPNAGEELKPLGRIASGGELSRVMLAIRNVLTETAAIGVYLFDEIDSGMGGQTAFVVGRKLQRVAARSQVICITHLAQVAAFADHQFVVQKRSEKGRTFAEVSALAAAARKREIARMLGGLNPNAKALSNAEELLREGRASRR